MMKIRFLTLADREVDDAVLWYEQQTELNKWEWYDNSGITPQLISAGDNP